MKMCLFFFALINDRMEKYCDLQPFCFDNENGRERMIR